jgi:glyoxylase-like metal-dependent hydrolase (beta-lactamase superfamily II)
MSRRAISRLSYPFPEVPAPGTTIEVAPGIRWLSMPLPFKLDHINLWLVEEEKGGNAGWTVVDTGIGNAETRALWEKILGKKHVKRVLLTHYHPDHAGNAAWLCERYGAPLWTTQGEYLTAHAVRTASAGYTPDAVLAVFRKNGLDEERAARMRGPRNRYAELVPDFPHSYRRIIERDEIAIGKHRWRALHYGHAPEHLSLFPKEPNSDRGRHAAFDHLDQRERMVDRSRGRSVASVPGFHRPLPRAAQGRPRAAFARQALPRRASPGGGAAKAP